MSRVVFHLDMDAFYASVEQRDNPALHGLPVIVGAPPEQRGVVCAASYEARKFGVRSAMPSATAHRLCPQGIFLRPRMDHYQAESRAIMALVAQTGGQIEQVSIDECYLEIPPTDSTAIPAVGAEALREQHDAVLYATVPLARELKQKIRHERGLTASIGIAANKFLAKLASDYQKPDGLTLLPERDKVVFLRSMPVRVIYGVGAVTEGVLHQAGLHTVGDVQDYPGDLRALVGSFWPTLKQFAFGQDDRPLETEEVVKSISSEETFARDTADRQVLRACLRAAAREIAEKLATYAFGAHTVQVKVRYGDFTTVSRQLTREDPITEAAEIYRLGCFLLGRHQLVRRPLRLLGLGVSGLVEPTTRQLVFW